MKKLRIGQIGIGHNHGAAKMGCVRKFPELFEVVGFAEEDEAWIRSRGSIYEGIPRMGVEELIGKCDALMIESDVWNLTKYAQLCVDAGKHIHVDKPGSGTMAEFEKLIGDARAKKLIVQMAYMYRYNFAVQRCMELLRTGALGEIYQIDAEMSTNHSDEYRQWLTHFKGGSMYIFGSHLIDLIVGMLGEPRSVHSFIKQTGYNGVYSDDNCFALLEYEKAVARVTTLSVEINGWGMRRFAVMGSNGTVEIKPMEITLHMTQATRDKAVNSYADIHEDVAVDDVPSSIRYDQLMKDFYRSITGEIENPYSYERELAVQRTICRVVGEN